MKDWLKSPEPEAMMGPKPKGGIEDIDEDLFEGLPPPEEPVGPDDGMQTVQLPSLKETCRRVLFRNVSAIEDLGDMPFSLVEDLLKVMRPEKLQEVESNSPHLLEHSDYIWKRHVLQEYPKYRKRYETDGIEPESWRELYVICGEEREQELAQLGNRLKERYAAAQDQRSSRKMVITERAPVRIGRRVGSSGGVQTKGSKILNRARGATLRLRAPRRRAPVKTVGEAHVPFLNRWNTPGKNSFEGYAFTQSISSPPQQAARPYVRNASRPTSTPPTTQDVRQPSTSASLPPPPQPAALAPPAPPSAASPVLDFFGNKAQPKARTSSKRSRPVPMVSVQKKRRIQPGSKASGSPQSSPPISAASPSRVHSPGSSSIGSPILTRPMSEDPPPSHGPAPWSPTFSPSSPSSTTTMDDSGSNGTTKLDSFGSSSKRPKRSQSKSKPPPAVTTTRRPSAPAAGSTDPSSAGASPTEPPAASRNAIPSLPLRSPAMPSATPADLYARANSQAPQQSGGR